MNTPTISPQLPSPLSESPLGTLDERIALAERRLISREQAVLHSAQALVQRAHEATRPRRLVRPAVYALGALALVWGAGRLLGSRRNTRKPRHTPASPLATPEYRSPSRLGEVPWARGAALLWPLLPGAWRGRVGPDAASMLVAVGVPLAGLLFRKRSQAPSQAAGSEAPTSSEPDASVLKPTEELP